MLLAAAPVRVRVNPERIQPDLKDLLSRIQSVAPGAYLVGGALRDLLDGRKPLDLDVVVPGEPRDAAEALRGSLGGHAFVMDTERDQYRVALEATDGASTIDIGRLDGAIEANLLQRDFTVNALAAPIEAGGELGEIVDPTNGLRDLKARKLRLVSETALREDPLRLLRAARLAVELGYEIDRTTASAVRDQAALITAAAAERQREELVRILATPRAAEGVGLLDELGLLSQLLPELDEGRGVEQPASHHYWDVFNHGVQTVAALDAMLSPQEPQEPRDRNMRQMFQQGMGDFPLREYLDGRQRATPRLVLLKLAGLLHDVSKPETRSQEADGSMHFYGHSEAGAKKAESICKRLRFGNNESHFVAQLVKDHLRPAQLSSGAEPSHRAIYRFFRDLEDAAPACLFLTLADGAAAAGPRLKPEGWANEIAYLRYLLDRHEEQTRVQQNQPRLITGDDLIEELGLHEGPLLGRLMASVNEAIGAGELTSREQALDYARRQLQDQAEETTG